MKQTGTPNRNKDEMKEQISKIIKSHKAICISDLIKESSIQLYTLNKLLDDLCLEGHIRIAKTQSFDNNNKVINQHVEIRWVK